MESEILRFIKYLEENMIFLVDCRENKEDHVIKSFKNTEGEIEEDYSKLLKLINDFLRGCGK